MVNLLTNGDHKAEITLEGGTGRSTIQSPANVHVEDGVITAEIVWSSSSYDLMIVDGKEYKPISNDNGQSVFMVEIPSLDTPLEIKAETVAMSAPHMIDYTITVSGKEILTNESASFASYPSLTQEELASWVDSLMSANSYVVGDQIVYSATVAAIGSNGGGFPAVATVGISAALGAIVAFVAVTIGKKKK